MNGPQYGNDNPFPGPKRNPPGFLRLLKSITLGAAVSILVMLVFGFILDAGLSRYINGQLPILTQLGKIPFLKNWIDGLNLAGVPETIMYTNLVRAELNASGLSDLLSGGMGISLKWIPILLFPLLSLGIGGYLSARRYSLRLTRDVLPVSLGIGAAYGLFLLLLSFLAGFHHQMDTKILFTSLKGSVDYTFSAGEALFHGVLFGTLFSWLGQKLCGGRYKSGKAPESFRPIKEAMLATGRGWAAASVLMLIFLLVNEGEDLPFRSALQLMPQLGGYAWGVANLGKLSIAMGGDQMAASVWAGISSVQGKVTPLLTGGGYPLLARLVIVVALGVLLWSGKRLAVHSGSLRVKLGRVLQFSLVYALSLAFLALVSNVELVFHGGAFATYEANGEAIAVGIGAIPMFLSSFALAFAVLSAGSILFKSRSRGAQESSVWRNSR